MERHEQKNAITRLNYARTFRYALPLMVAQQILNADGSKYGYGVIGALITVFATAEKEAWKETAAGAALAVAALEFADYAATGKLDPIAGVSVAVGAALGPLIHFGAKELYEFKFRGTYLTAPIYRVLRIEDQRS